MMAINESLTEDAWLKLVEEEVYRPSGVLTKARYQPLHTDLFPTRRGDQLPDFSGGLMLSARELSKVMRAVQSGDLLSDHLKEEFLSETHHAHVTKWDLIFLPLAAGMWRYAQGHWISCDQGANTWGWDNFWFLQDLEGVNAACQGSSRSPEI